MPPRFYLTGSVYVERGARLLDERSLVGRQGRLVLALLACERRRLVSKDELAEELWPNAPPDSWERALSAVVSKLRAALCQVGLANETIEASFGCYRLRLPGDAWIDVEAAAEGLHRAESALRAGDPKQAWGWAQVAYHITRRPFLVGDDGPWATRKRAELRDILVRSHDCLSELFVWNDEPALAAKHAEQAVTLEPFREAGYQRLMRAHAASGNRAEALRAYERCRRLLADELGVSPSPQTEAVYLEILRS